MNESRFLTLITPVRGRLRIGRACISPQNLGGSYVKFVLSTADVLFPNNHGVYVREG